MFGKKEYCEMNSLLNSRFSKKKTLIAQHRGAKNGNVVENTLLAFSTSYLLGADIVELDVSLSRDGKLYCFHDTTEEKNLRIHENIETHTSDFIDECTLYNSIWLPSNYHVTPLEEVFKKFTNNELFNIDRSWTKLEQTFDLLRKHPNIWKQVILKGPAKKEILDAYENEKIKFMFMPIIKTIDDLELVLSYKNINIVGLEVIISDSSSLFFQDEWIKKIHDMNYFIWVNVITLSALPKHILSAGFDDNHSLEFGFENGWGVLLKKQIDILQTDWPELLSPYRDRFYNLKKEEDTK